MKSAEKSVHQKAESSVVLLVKSACTKAVSKDRKRAAWKAGMWVDWKAAWLGLMDWMMAVSKVAEKVCCSVETMDSLVERTVALMVEKMDWACYQSTLYFLET